MLPLLDRNLCTLSMTIYWRTPRTTHGGWDLAASLWGIKVRSLRIILQWAQDHLSRRLSPPQSLHPHQLVLDLQVDLQAKLQFVQADLQVVQINLRLSLQLDLPPCLSHSHQQDLDLQVDLRFLLFLHLDLPLSLRRSLPHQRTIHSLILLSLPLRIHHLSL